MRILITIDTAVMGNNELIDAWRLYKMVVRDQSALNHANGVVDEEFGAFEKMLVALDNGVLSGKSFLCCIEQVSCSSVFVGLFQRSYLN